MTRLKTSPSFLKGLKASLVTSYGITDESVFSRKSFLGFKFGKRPTVRLENVTRVYPSGGLFGDVHFGEGSHTPVIWKNVFRPGPKAEKAEATIEKLLEARKPPAPPWHEGLELEENEIAFPPFPPSIYDALKFGKGFFSLTPISIGEGSWVREGDPMLSASPCPDDFEIASHMKKGRGYDHVMRFHLPNFKADKTNSTIVKAPCAGMIISSGLMLDSHEGDQFGQWEDEIGDFQGKVFYPLPDDSSYPVLFSFKPVKGKLPPRPYAQALSGITKWCESFINDRARVRRAFEQFAGRYEEMEARRYESEEDFVEKVKIGIAHIQQHEPIERSESRTRRE